MKNIRMTKATSTTLNVLAAQTGLPIGDLISALLKFQAAGKYLTRLEDSERFGNMWDQAVLSAKRAGKSGWTGHNETQDVNIVINANTDEE